MTEDRGGHDDPCRVRDVPKVISEMDGLRAACAFMDDDAAIADAFDAALSLMLELRVPRMPDSDEELEAMLRDRGAGGRLLTSEQVFAELEEHGRRFSAFLGRYRDDVGAGRWDQAAASLMPVDGVAGIAWQGGPYRLSHSRDGLEAVVSDHGETRPDVTGHGRCAGTAALAAILGAHIEWRSAWWR